MSDYIPCTSYHHNIHSGSIHEKHKVPIELFLNTKNGKQYKTCLDCRNSDKITCAKSVNNSLVNQRKLKSQHDEDIENNNDFVTCPGSKHNKASDLARDKVPIQNFKLYPDRKISSFTVNCVDCRLYDRDKNKQNKAQLLAHCKNNNIIICTRCETVIDNSNKATNLDGTQALSCKPCKDGCALRMKSATNIHNELKINLINENESCCSLCHSLLIIEDQNITVVVTIPTFMDDNIRYCEYKNIIYTSLDFIKLFKDKIALGVLEFDHLLESEQREAGILLDGDLYEPKDRGVAQFHGTENIINEAKKCKLVCSKCHVIETVRREKGIKELTRAKLERQKLNHCNELKKQGCTNCHYVNNDIPRFFNFDHIDPLLKLTNISIMMREPKYTFNDMLNEIKKTRILCKYCHFIHTADQHKQGLIEKVRTLRNNTNNIIE